MSQIGTNNIWSETTLREVIIPVSERIPVSDLTVSNYISTENMEVDIGGVRDAVNLPTISNVLQFLPGDILFSNIRTYFKKLWQSDRFGGASNDVLIFRGNDTLINKSFLFYVLSQDVFFEHTVKTSKGTKMPRGDKDAILNFSLLLPPLSEQETIAVMLSSFDNKIELLREQNNTLEATAQTIFQEWFGKYSIDHELPDGWRVDVLDNLVDLIIDYRGRTPKKLGMDWSPNGIPALSAKTIKNGKIVNRDAMNFGDEELYSIWMKDELKQGDILLTSEAPLGEMYYLLGETKYILSQRLFAIRASNIITSQYLYLFLYSPTGQHLLNARASGSTVEGIRQSELRRIKIIVPKADILLEASSIFQGLFQKISINEEQILSLSKTRDELLPKLIKGEVRVN